jgi:ribonuclease HI
MNNMLTPEQIKDPKELHLYTDGACSPNPGKGGWGSVFVNPKTGKSIELSGASVKSTNNKMELTAVIEPLEWLLERKGPQIVRVFSDSKYVIGGITGWIYNWEKNYWLLSNGDPVKNCDLWKRLQACRKGHKLVYFEWVKGHAGNEYNEAADKLAVAARSKI